MSAVGRIEPGLAVGRVAVGMRTPVVAWVVSRALVIGLGILFSVVLGPGGQSPDPSVPHGFSLFGIWDASWYLDVARYGYDHDLGQVGHLYTNLAFAPLVPGIAGLGLLLRLNPFLLVFAVSNLAFLGALVGFHRLGAIRFGEDLAGRATWALAFFPAAAYASLAYTEGITLALAIVAALAALRGRVALAGVAAALATLARPTGVIVVVLVALLAWERGSPGKRIGRLALAVAPTVAATAAYLGWLQVARGSWSLPFVAQRAWDRGQLGIGLVTAAPRALAAGWSHVVNLDVTGTWAATARDVAFGLLYLWLLVLLRRAEGSWRSPWVIYSLLVVALPLSSGSVVSLGRFGLLAFPLFWPLAVWLGRDRRRWAWSGGAAVLVTALLIAQLHIGSP